MAIASLPTATLSELHSLCSTFVSLKGLLRLASPPPLSQRFPRGFVLFKAVIFVLAVLSTALRLRMTVLLKRAEDGSSQPPCLLARFLRVAPSALCVGALADAAAWCLGWPALPCTTSFFCVLSVLTVRQSFAHPPAAWAAHYLTAPADVLDHLFGSLVKATWFACHALRRRSRRAAAAAAAALARRRLRRAPSSAPPSRVGESPGGAEHSLVLAPLMPRLPTDDAARCAVLSRRLRTAAASLPSVAFDAVATPPARITSAVVQARCTLAGVSLRRLVLTTLPLPVRDVLDALAAAPCVEELETFCGEPPCGSVRLLTNSSAPFVHGQ